MSERIQQGGLQVAEEIFDLVANELTPGTGVTVEHFWAFFEEIINDLTPKNREPVSYTHLTLPTIILPCIYRWSPYH